MSGVPTALTRNWTLKLASVALALFLWALVRTGPAERELLSGVPVRVQIGDLGWTLAGAPQPQEVQVRFAGSASDIMRIDRAGASVRVTIDSVLTADTLIELRRDWVSVEGMSGLVVQDIVPAAVRLTFERTAQTALPLLVRTVGRLPRGLALAAPIGLTPTVVRVHGPARLVSALDSLPLQPIDLAAVSGSEIVEVAVDTAGLGGLILAPTTAALSFRVETAVEQMMASLPVEVEGPAAAGLTLDPDSMGVLLRGAAGRVGAAVADSLRIVVAAESVQDVAPGEARSVPVRVDGLPPLVEGVPVVDSVTVRRPIGPEAGDGGQPTPSPGGDAWPGR